MYIFPTQNTSKESKKKFDSRIEQHGESILQETRTMKETYSQFKGADIAIVSFSNLFGNPRERTKHMHMDFQQ